MDQSSAAAILNKHFPGKVSEDPAGWLLIDPAVIRESLAVLKDQPDGFDSLHSLTAVDRRERLEVVYHLYSYSARVMLTCKAYIPVVDPVIDSVTALWSSADWFEREVYDLFGIKFTGHPDLRRILNPESWSEHPLRKDFKRPDVIVRPVK